MQIAFASFGEEDRDTLHALVSLGSGETGATDPLGQAAYALHQLHERAAPLDVRRELVADQFGDQAAQRYQMLELEEEVWQGQFNAYREQAKTIRSRAELGEEAREREIIALLERSFSDHAQRLRARWLDHGL
jgi:lipase chaperone LimK